VHEPPLVVADEPTAHLDHIQVEGILVLLRELATAGRMVIVSTHDDRITHIADRVIELSPQFSAAEQGDEERRFDKGALVFAQGDRGDLVYEVEEGVVEIFRERSDGTEEVLATIGPGNYFGEIGPMLNLPRSASARALETTRLTGMSVRSFRSRFPMTVQEARAPSSGAAHASGGAV